MVNKQASNASKHNFAFGQPCASNASRKLISLLPKTPISIADENLSDKTYEWGNV